MLELNTCRSSPIRDIAMATLLLTSTEWSPFAVNIEPRYLNSYTFFKIAFMHFIDGCLSCASESLIFLTFFSAQVPTKFCCVGCCQHLLSWIFTPCTLLQGLSQCWQRPPCQFSSYRLLARRKSFTTVGGRLFLGCQLGFMSCSVP